MGTRGQRGQADTGSLTGGAQSGTECGRVPLAGLHLIIVGGV